jgi:hypothetical protein
VLYLWRSKRLLVDRLLIVGCTSSLGLAYGNGATSRSRFILAPRTLLDPVWAFTNKNTVFPHRHRQTDSSIPPHAHPGTDRQIAQHDCKRVFNGLMKSFKISCRDQYQIYLCIFLQKLVQVMDTTTVAAKTANNNNIHHHHILSI